MHQIASQHVSISKKFGPPPPPPEYSWPSATRTDFSSKRKILDRTLEDDINLSKCKTSTAQIIFLSCGRNLEQFSTFSQERGYIADLKKVY